MLDSLPFIFQRGKGWTVCVWGFGIIFLNFALVACWFVGSCMRKSSVQLISRCLDMIGWLELYWYSYNNNKRKNLVNVWMYSPLSLLSKIVGSYFSIFLFLFPLRMQILVNLSSTTGKVWRVVCLFTYGMRICEGCSLKRKRKRPWTMEYLVDPNSTILILRVPLWQWISTSQGNEPIAACQSNWVSLLHG